MREPDARFDDRIDQLERGVIQGDYGFEDGEFTVYPEHWRPMFDKNLTPAQAFRRALDAHGAARREEEAQRAENWRRIQAEDAAAIAAHRAREAGQ